MGDLMCNRDDHTLYPSYSDEWRTRLEAPSDMCREESHELHDRPISSSVAASQGSSGFQRKFIPLMPPSCKHQADSADHNSVPRHARQPLVVVASLIDKIPNLAGLARTCEIFNCSSICYASKKVMRDATFQAISVTAERWLPIEEVPRSQLRDHLLKLQKKGYQLVGIEQTHNSVSLDSFQFTACTALVLGAEKEGIDAELLPLLDVCVEIPQSGQLRSLNVHVSGALTVWEYTRQQRAAEN